MTPAQRERAEAAFGHVQLAATEMILAAQDALDLLGDVVSTFAVGGVLDRLSGRSAAADTASEEAPVTPPGPAPSRRRSRVERVPVR